MTIATLEEKIENKEIEQVEELEKKLLAAEMFEASKSARQMAETLSVSRPTVFAWKRIWKEKGVDGLKAIKKSTRVRSSIDNMRVIGCTMPVKLHDFIQKSAKLNRRSISGEILFRLEQQAKKDGYEPEEEC